MTENGDTKYEGFYSVAIIDLFDAYHYADVFDEERYAFIGRNYSDLGKCIELADRLFKALNPKASTQEEWVEWEAGHDVHIYTDKFRCVYKAHTKLPAGK